MKAIIFLPTTSRYAPAVQGEYQWNETHQKHIWQGRELDAKEFNRVIDRLVENAGDYQRPSVRLIPQSGDQPSGNQPVVKRGGRPKKKV